jgi:hypothetical protein
MNINANPAKKTRRKKCGNEFVQAVFMLGSSLVNIAKIANVGNRV